MSRRGLFLGVLLFVLSTVGVSAQEYQRTPYEKVESEVEAYRSFSEGAELVQMLRAYASWNPCLSVHREGSGLVFYWWCSRLMQGSALIEEAYLIENVY